ncbi:MULTISPECIES: Fic family protein [unclassified Paenibacillus]|uniref:Fic family protein n=1 Tax=unclassified Paenibacillus TaxID=185978 RepID=UPI002118BD15|nr:MULTISPECIES: Fic family protein [unclassified Paenibacillus]
MFTPKYSITDAIARRLMDIQRASVVVDLLPLPASILDLLKKESMEKTVILSTKIEGNTLDEAAKRKVLYQTSSDNEEQEVYNLMKALEYLDEAERRQLPVTEEFIKKLHAIIRISHGRRPRVSEYREEQNQVGSRNASGFYLPPEWKDVPVLMEDLVAWVNSPETYSVPVPIKAGIFMWQFLTINPYMDGNGRTARMITTYLLRRGGYGLKGLFVLENFYDRNLAEYYRRLQLGLHHNYYFGRNEADLTPWLEFFIDGLAEVFEEAAAIVTEKSAQMTKIEPDLIRKLDPQQRMVFAQLTFKQDTLTTSEMRDLLRLSDRSIREKVSHWREEGFIEPRDQDAKRVRSIKLSAEYEKLAQDIRNAPDKFAHFLK